jgi:hypothetical protein
MILQWIAYHVTILFAALLVAECLFLPETLFPRAFVLASETRSQRTHEGGVPGGISNIKRTKELGYIVRLYIWLNTGHTNYVKRASEGFPA